ncbi:MAG TPA: AMP-binding protein, partial [Puia sp.]|nr:AMP-binding protein [Puia sp.]
MTTLYPPANQLKILQERKLREILEYVAQNSPFYRELFKDRRIDIASIRTLEDLTRIPTTGKADLQTRNSDFLCVGREKIAEYMATSGTLGSPVTVALTEKDLERLAYNEYNSFLCADGSADETYQLMLTLDRQFMAGIAYYSGLRRLGAGIIRVGPGVPALQWETIQRLKPTVLVVVPSFLLKLIRYAQDRRIDLGSSSVKKAICIGENIRNQDFSLNILGRKITEAWNIKLYSTYASTEMQTAFTECGAGQGGHLQPELLIVELL